MEIIRCPNRACHAPAEIEDRWYQGSTHGPVEHAKTRCLDKHVFTVPTDSLSDCPPETEVVRSHVSGRHQARGRPRPP